MATRRRKNSMQLSALTLTVAILSLNVATQVSVWQGVKAQVSASPATNQREERTREPDTRKNPASCAEAHLCKTGEKRMMLPPTTLSTLKTYTKQGCTVRHVYRGGVSMKCPEAVTVAGARVERIFKTTDLPSVAQVHADIVHLAGVTGKGVRVAVLDTGADAQHPELAGRVVAQQAFTTDSGVDAVGHGTHVAGIIAGQGVEAQDENGVANRVLGISPGADILVGKVCGDEGWCAESDILSGIEWAVAQKARVINLSLGGGKYTASCDSDTLAAQVNWAVSQGTVVVAASGNDGGSGPGIALPACASKAVAVGAVDHNDVRPSWSNTGDGLDVVAPGVDILSSVSCAADGTCPIPSYGWWSGTSMAAPQVAGVVALLLEKQPQLTPGQVWSVLTSTAKALGAPGPDPEYGYGRVDAEAALLMNIGAGSSSAQSAAGAVSSVSSSVPSSAASSPTSSAMSSVSSVMSSVASSQSSAAASSKASSVSSKSGAASSSAAVSSASSVPSAEPPPACTANAWFCREFSECNDYGWQERFCQLIDARCKDPGKAKPEQSRACDVHRRNEERQEERWEEQERQREEKKTKAEQEREEQKKQEERQREEQKQALERQSEARTNPGKDR